MPLQIRHEKVAPESLERNNSCYLLIHPRPRSLFTRHSINKTTNAKLFLSKEMTSSVWDQSEQMGEHRETMRQCWLAGEKRPQRSAAEHCQGHGGKGAFDERIRRGAVTTEPGFNNKILFICDVFKILSFLTENHSVKTTCLPGSETCMTPVPVLRTVLWSNSTQKATLSQQ